MKCEKLLPKPVVKYVIDPLYKKFFHPFREKRISCGNLNSDITFYVIRNLTEKQGILNNWIEVVRKIEYANQKGYVPIVDFLHYPREIVMSEEKNREINAWDYYFEQPQKEYSLEEVYKSKNVILSFGMDVYDQIGWPTYLDDKACEKYHEYYKRYAGFNERMQNYLEQEEEKYIPNNKKILGVSMRRELEYGNLMKDPFYTENIQHQPQTSLEDTETKIQKYMREFSCDCFLFVCDDEETCEYIKKKYKDTVIVYDRPRNKFFIDGKPNNKLNEIDTETRTLGYLTETYLLSKCNSMIGINTSSVTMACIINGNSFEHKI